MMDHITGVVVFPTFLYPILTEKGLLGYYLNLAPTIYCGLKRLATILGAKFRYYDTGLLTQ